VKKALLSLTLALAANSAFAATVVAGNVAATVIDHGTQFIAQAYPATQDDVNDFIPCEDAYVAPNRTWTGADDSTNGPNPAEPIGDDNSRAVGGVLSLKRDGTELDADAFATCPAGQNDAYVQMYRLKKTIPGSRKCPSTYAPQSFFQFGADVRTWWTLIYTQPGTKFQLEVHVVCFNNFGHPATHIDRYTWEVVATFDSLLNVLDLLHQGALGTTEIPCIAGEDMYDALKEMIEDLREASDFGDDGELRAEAQNLLFDLEACIISFACFADCFIPEDIFSAKFPPTNTLQFGDYGFTGIIDTLENPCACKLLVDVEYIATCYGIASN
jgi:DNA-binding ferritin-like protein (Dps family)